LKTEGSATRLILAALGQELKSQLPIEVVRLVPAADLTRLPLVSPRWSHA
jgi:hypothetical protein